MITWFGPTWESQLNKESPEVPAPIGAACTFCHEMIVEGESGVMMNTVGISSHITHYPYHLECHLRTVVGGINHQLHLCRCFKGTKPSDPEGMPPRIAAKAAVDLYYSRSQAALN